MSAAAAAALRAEGNALFAAASHAAAADKYTDAADAARAVLAEAVKATGEPPNPGCPEAGECVRAPAIALRRFRVRVLTYAPCPFRFHSPKSSCWR